MNICAAECSIYSIQTLLAMEVIVNADDLGYSVRRDTGILCAFRDGTISSASLIVNGATSDTAAKSAKDARLPVGLHLNLTEGRPLSDAPHIVDERGYLLYKMNFWYLKKTPQVLADIARETRAQLEKFKDLMGDYPTRVDGHQHVHVARQVPETIAPVLRECGVKCVRIPDQDPDHMDWLDAQTRRRYESRYVPSVTARLVYGRHGLKSPMSFVGLGISGGEMTMERIHTCMRKCIGTTEFMVHPGFLTPDSESKDAFDSDPGRLREYHVLKSVACHYTLVDWSTIK